MRVEAGTAVGLRAPVHAARWWAVSYTSSPCLGASRGSSPSSPKRALGYYSPSVSWGIKYHRLRCDIQVTWLNYIVFFFFQGPRSGMWDCTSNMGWLPGHTRQVLEIALWENSKCLNRANLRRKGESELFCNQTVTKLTYPQECGHRIFIYREICCVCIYIYV